MRIFNGTPHSINIISNCVYKPEIRKYVVPEGEQPIVVKSIPSNGILSAKIQTVNAGVVDGIPVFNKQVVGCDDLPAGYDIYIVSALYAVTAIKMGANPSILYTVSDPVYSADGRTILGSRGICPAF